MATRKTHITEAELGRYLKALRRAGFASGRVEIVQPDGTKISVIAGEATEPTPGADDFDTLIGRIPKDAPPS